MSVAALCHICQRPTTRTCRACGLPACSAHLGQDGRCDLCRSGQRPLHLVR